MDELIPPTELSVFEMGEITLLSGFTRSLCLFFGDYSELEPLS